MGVHLVAAGKDVVYLFAFGRQSDALLCDRVVLIEGLHFIDRYRWNAFEREERREMEWERGDNQHLVKSWDHEFEVDQRNDGRFEMSLEIEDKVCESGGTRRDFEDWIVALGDLNGCSVWLYV